MTSPAMHPDAAAQDASMDLLPDRPDMLTSSIESEHPSIQQARPLFSSQPPSPAHRFTPTPSALAPSSATNSPRASFSSSPLSFRPTNAFGSSFTPPRFFAPQLNSPGPFPLLPNSALPLSGEESTAPAGFSLESPSGGGGSGSTYGSPRLHSPSPRLFEVDSNSFTMAQNSKRKRHMSDSSATPRELLFTTLKRNGHSSSSLNFSRDQASSMDDGSDTSENENGGKKLKVRELVGTKIRRTSQTLQFHDSIEARQVTISAASNGGGLIGVMDRLSIESESNTEDNGLSLRKSSSSPFKKERSRLQFGGETVIEDGNDAQAESSAMDETNCEEESDSRPTRLIRPLPARRRLRSPPPIPVAPEEDTEEDEDDENTKPKLATITTSEGGRDKSAFTTIDSSTLSDSPPLTFSQGIYSTKPNSEEVDDEEDLAMGSKGAFYYKPTAAERWARSQKRLQQIREYKDRESREARERRRRRRAASVGSGVTSGSIRRKVHFAA